ncbi:MAG: hypothetical protein DRO36_05690 [Candidatus Hecatellales archaeon]|nr:MAG: hypothetical protein DRO36_05690 [Candidatus Hecatellales archaeon]
MKLHIGFDDTDSLKGGCTTYLASCLIELLYKLKFVRFLDYPNLVRLNPNIPWKTRGNGAVCLRLEIPEWAYLEVRERVVGFVERSFRGEAETNPGIVFLKGDVSEQVKGFSFEALWRVVSLSRALRLIRVVGGEAYGFNNCRGIIGALAACGETLEDDYTFEVIAYRTRRFWGKPRKIDPESVLRMDRETYPQTFNNLDPETGRILIMPRGPDPVLFGVRGETVEAVLKALKMVSVDEPIERWTVFRTNHGTDNHLRCRCRVAEVKPHMAVVVEGWVSKPPKTIPGRHVIFSVSDGTGEIFCAAYEPTGELRKVVKGLVVGDRVRVYGGLRKAKPRTPKTINLEKIEVLELTRKVELKNPLCPRCGKRMVSMGKGKGFRCEKCGFRDSKAKKVEVEVPRSLKEGLYLPPPRSHRHLTKPIQRYGMEKHGWNFEEPKVFWGRSLADLPF